NRGVPVFDRAEAADHLPNFRRKTRGFRSLLDRDRVGRPCCDKYGQPRDQGKFYDTHAFLCPKIVTLTVPNTPAGILVKVGERARQQQALESDCGKVSFSLAAVGL